jgi:hypothetical protein
MQAHVYSEWRLTSATKFRFLELVHQYEQVEEDSDAAEAIRQTIKSLPNYPTSAPTDGDILLVVTDVQH